MIFGIRSSLRDSTTLADGTALSEVINYITDCNCTNLRAIGCNCVPLDMVSDALRTFKLLSKLPLIVYPNSGERYDPVSKTWHGHNDCTLETMARSGVMLNIGARSLAGFCRTGPDDYCQAS